MSNWKPIYSAPRDGRSFVVRGIEFDGEIVFCVHHWSEGWNQFIDSYYDDTRTIHELDGAEWAELPQ